MNKLWSLPDISFVCTLLVCLSGNLVSCGQTAGKSQAASKTMENKSGLPETEAGWKQKLSPDQYYILREKGTERPYSGKLLLNKQKGVYTCAGCGAVLFSSGSKFDSHCGWPSFDKEIAEGRIKTHEDNSHGMRRTEITCARCNGHLGHVFNDGPTATGLRYCVNSLSLEFVKDGETSAATDKSHP